MTQKDILKAPFVEEMVDITTNMYRLGWDERNGGNISYLLTEEQLSLYLDVEQVFREIKLPFNANELAGRYFIVTGSGKYFKNVSRAPSDNLGVIRVSKDGNSVQVLWGLDNDAMPTSELPSHFMSHISRLSIDSTNRIIMHCHTTHLLAMTFTHSLDERALTRTLWKMCTECLVVFPEGISTIPWIVPGTMEIGKATAEKMKQTRLVVWPYHGIYGAGKNLDEAFGLVETAEKAAQVYTITQAQGGINQTISDENLKALAKDFYVTPRADYLE
ncbi:rhamnulose-1-phosphate aldolase [Tetragenococcus halophilus]|nr:rhamnulose-1-phosphate aldolase [Tetragenococcus halophilus]